jgi:hypothetical protein
MGLGVTLLLLGLRLLDVARLLSNSVRGSGLRCLAIRGEEVFERGGHGDRQDEDSGPAWRSIIGCSGQGFEKVDGDPCCSFVAKGPRRVEQPPREPDRQRVDARIVTIGGLLRHASL